MTRQEKIEQVRAWWASPAAAGLTATKGAAACAEALGLKLNSVRGLQNAAWPAGEAPWCAAADGKVCPRCNERKPLSGFGQRKVWRGGELKTIPQSYCHKCR